MASRSSFLPRISLGGNGSSVLPLHHDRKRSNDYDLSDLSPRPSSPLLSPDYAHEFASQDASSVNGGAAHGKAQGKGKSKAKAVAYAEHVEQFPPVSVVDRMRMYRENKASAMAKSQYVEEERRLQNGPSWRPPTSNDYHDHEEGVMISPRQGQPKVLGSSFMGFLNPTQSTMESSTPTDIDTTFRTIQRRERQIQKELQKLLDAQAAALERGPASAGASQAESDTPRGTSRASSGGSSASPYRTRTVSFSNGPVVPVRQPKARPPTIRQVRNSIARSMSMLADLKEEEDAYITSAMSIRKTAVSKANKLSNQHKTIAADLRSLEKDDPLQKELDDMSGDHQKVCRDIEEFEGRLRALKHQKRVLEARMEEVRSERESGLSGYRGALRDTERGIGEMMRTPGVKVLSTEGIDLTGPQEGDQESTADTLEGHVGGREFMRMRPERRTLGMAKEWWEGEMKLLSSRKVAVDRERDALSEGVEIWNIVVQVIIDFERRLGAALSESMSVAAKGDRDTIEEALFRAQSKDLRATIVELEKNLRFVEDKGWNLLVAAIGAELEGFLDAQNILSGLMKDRGFTDGSTGEGLLDLDEHQNGELSKSLNILSQPNRQLKDNRGDDGITASVMNRWAGVTEPSPSSPPLSPASPPPQISQYEDAVENPQPDSSRDLGLEGTGEPKYESDNEVPPGLFGETAHVEESEDEHPNEVPAEFLNMHDVPPTSEADPKTQEESDNEVPHDLLAEGTPETKDDEVD